MGFAPPNTGTSTCPQYYHSAGDNWPLQNCIHSQLSGKHVPAITQDSGDGLTDATPSIPTWRPAGCCSTIASELTAPPPTRAAHITRPAGRRPRAAEIGSLVDNLDGAAGAGSTASGEESLVVYILLKGL